MSWYTGSFPNTNAGQLVSMLDVQLVKNAHWTIYDTPAANKRVYCCSDSPNNCLFYLYIDDTNAGYGIAELWEGWSIGGHVGSGVSQKTNAAAQTAMIYFGAGNYGISVRDRCLYLVDFTTWQHYYFGQPRRRDVSKNIVMMCACTSGNVSFNPLGVLGDNTNSAVWSFLFDENRCQTHGAPLILSTYYVRNINNVVEFYECQVRNTFTNLVVGDLEGCFGNYSATAPHPDGLLQGDTISIGGVTWIVVNPAAGLRGQQSFAQEA